MPGFRTALEQSRFPKLALGGQCNFVVPRDLNALPYTDDKKGIFPEFFISMNSVKEGTVYDGGILKKGDQWYAFIFGGSSTKTIWKETRLENLDGQTVNVKFKGKKINGVHQVCLYVNYNLVVTVGPEDKSSQYCVENNKSMGIHAEAPSRHGVWRLRYELNLVPQQKEAGYISYTDSEGRAYFRNASVRDASPVDDSGYTIPYQSTDTIINNDGEYGQSVVNKVCTVSNSGIDHFTSSIDFNNA